LRQRPSSTDYTTLAEDLASHGYVVGAGAPTYSASVVVFPGGRVARSTALGSLPGGEDAPVTGAKIRKDQAAGARLVGVWAKDMSFELDRMAKLDDEKGARFYRTLDVDRAGMLGHSLGGATALSACASDARCDAAANLDGTPTVPADCSVMALPSRICTSRATCRTPCATGSARKETAGRVRSTVARSTGPTT
jgi:dienelactone hydrolase